jgi:hypothetical protein
MRRYRDIVALLESDQGGSEAISEAARAIIKRASALCEELERLEMLFALAGEATPHQLELHGRTSNTLRRLLESLGGLQRRPRDVTPTLGELLRDDLRRQQEEASWPRTTGCAVVDHLTASALERWRRNPISFIEQCLNDPETHKPFRLLPAERTFLQHAFKTDKHGRLLYPLQTYSCPKKSGKTTFAAIHALTTTLLFGGSFPEATICANDL